MPALNQRLGLARYEADEYYRRALDAYRKGSFDDAIDAMTDALELLPNKAEYYAARGFFQLEDGAIAEAQADFEAALRHFPYEMLAHYGLGMIAYKRSAWDQAIAHFTNAYKSDTARGETLYYLALAYLHKGERAAALNIMGRAQAAFEAANDKRRAQADRVVRELAKLVERVPGLTAGGVVSNE